MPTHIKGCGLAQYVAYAHAHGSLILQLQEHATCEVSDARQGRLEMLCESHSRRRDGSGGQAGQAQQGNSRDTLTDYYTVCEVPVHLAPATPRVIVVMCKCEPLFFSSLILCLSFLGHSFVFKSLNGILGYLAKSLSSYSVCL